MSLEGQHKASLRKIVRSALAHRAGADVVLEAILELQVQLNALLAKLDADTGVIDTDYVSTLGVEEIDLDS